MRNSFIVLATGLVIGLGAYIFLLYPRSITIKNVPLEPSTTNTSLSGSGHYVIQMDL